MSGIGELRAQRVRSSRPFLDNTSLAADAPIGVSHGAQAIGAGAIRSAISSGEAAGLPLSTTGISKRLVPRGETDNVGDGFLFGGERHGPAAQFAGRVGLDPEGVAHFGFVSFGCLRPSSGARLTVRRGRGGKNWPTM